MPRNEKYPPRLGERILRGCLRNEDFHHRLGDFQEAYQIIVETEGKYRAVRWYWGQVLRSVPELAKNSFYWSAAMFNNYIKIAFRNLKKYKGYSFINIAGLAVGMACCILILLWVQDELSYDTFHEKANNLFRITVSAEQWSSGSSPWALMPALKKDFPEIVKGTWYDERTLPVGYEENAYYENFALVHPEFLEMFTFPFIEGNPKTAFSNLNSVVITQKTAEKYFGNDDPLGKVIHFDNRIDLEVTGVIQNVPPNSHIQFDCLTHPIHVFGEQRLSTWSADCSSYVLLHGGIALEEINQKISDTINKRDTRTNYKFYVSLQPLKEIHLYALNGTDPIVYVYLFSAIAAIVLLIACINFMNLTTARSSNRAREVGMRKVVGASRRDVIRQFFGESVLLSLIALFMAILLVYLFLPYFNTLAVKQLSLNVVSHIPVVIGIFLIAILTGIISGVYPALFLSAFQPAAVLKNSIDKSSKGRLFRKALIIVQFTASIALIISTTVIFNQMHYIRTKDLGFDREQIITIRTNREIRIQYEEIKQELLRNSSIHNVTAASSIPLRINNNNPVYWEGGNLEQYVRMNFVCVDYDYFETFDMNMAYGRSFSREYSTDIENYIINEATLKLTGYEDPIGRMFSMWTDEGEIVGVVKDFHGTSLHNDIRPVVFVLYKNLPYFHMFIKINTTDISGAISAIRNTMSKFVPNFIFKYTFLDEEFNSQYQNEERIRKILEYFTFLAVFVSCLGLLGLASFSAERRTKEIGVRKVLGASVSGIIFILTKDIIKWILLANAVAWPVAYFSMHRWLQSFAYRTNLEMWMFLFSAILTLCIALLTVSYQSAKAARSNPVESLRCE